MIIKHWIPRRKQLKPKLEKLLAVEDKNKNTNPQIKSTETEIMNGGNTNKYQNLNKNDKKVIISHYIFGKFSFGCGVKRIFMTVATSSWRVHKLAINHGQVD